MKNIYDEWDEIRGNREIRFCRRCDHHEVRNIEPKTTTQEGE